MLKGRATAEATLAYGKRFPSLSYQEFGGTGLVVSEAGFGGYRVDSGVPEHRAALARALRSGVNLVDTSANYADGGSERLTGQVLQELAAAGMPRSEIVVVTKGGYLQGWNLEQSLSRRAEGRPFPDLVPFAEDMEHCIHPDFLEWQIDKSLERLDLECVDCFLLHNPEYYLKWAEAAGVPRREAQTEYLRRIREAFHHLEREVRRGRIGCYGVSSNTFVLPRREYAYSPLAEMWGAAAAISPGHSFRVVELPCNLFETGAVTEANQPDRQTTLEFARARGLAVLINRPLNAIRGGRLVRLAESAYQGKSAQDARDFRRKVAALDPAWYDAESLEHLSLRALRTTAGVTSVLVGMRREAYVENVLQELGKACGKTDNRSSWSKLHAL